MMTTYAPMLDFAGSILYLAALLGDRPRSIDPITSITSGTGRSAPGDPNRPCRRVWPSECARRCLGNRDRSATAAPDRSGACSGGLKFPEPCKRLALIRSSNFLRGRRSIAALRALPMPTLTLATCVSSSRWSRMRCTGTG